jgi:hypothetical protein
MSPTLLAFLILQLESVLYAWASLGPILLFMLPAELM